jgi:hypothetical protein
MSTDTSVRPSTPFRGSVTTRFPDDPEGGLQNLLLFGEVILDQLGVRDDAVGARITARLNAAQLRIDHLDLSAGQSEGVGTTAVRGVERGFLADQRRETVVLKDGGHRCRVE